MMAVDPVTTAAAIKTGLEIAQGLKSVFGGASNDTAAIREQLSFLQEQNRQIISRLDAVLDILGQLDVIVQRSVRTELVNQVRDKLAAKLQLAYESRSAELDGRRAERVAAADNYRALLPGLAENARQLAMNATTYGFGHFDVVGQSMMAEAWMSRRLRYPLAFRREASTVYKPYFEQVLNPAVAGSIGAQLSATAQQRDRLDAILVRADAAVRAGYRIRTREELRRERCRGGNRIITEVVTRAVLGDRQAGYREEVVGREGRRDDMSACGGGDGPGGGGGMGGSGLKMAAPDPVELADPAPKVRARYWNDVRTVHAQLVKDHDVLAVAAATARIYLDEAKRLTVER